MIYPLLIVVHQKYRHQYIDKNRKQICSIIWNKSWMIRNCLCCIIKSVRFNIQYSLPVI